MQSRTTMTLTLALVAGLSVALPTAAVSAAPDSTVTRCHEEFKTKVQHKNDRSSGDDEWTIRVGVGYRVCVVNPGRDYAEVTYDIKGYNQEGNRMSCSPFSPNALRFVKFNSYYYDHEGRNMNPPQIKVDCDESTMNSRTTQYPASERERLYYVRGNDGEIHSPNSRHYWKVEKATGQYEVDGTIGIALTKDGRIGQRQGH